MVKIALNLRSVLSCERDQTSSIRRRRRRRRSICSLVRVSLSSLRLRWVDDPRGMSRSTPSMTARLFFFIFFFFSLLYCTEIRSLPVLADRPRRASCLAACSVMMVVTAVPMYNIIIIILITRSSAGHSVIIILS